MLDDDRNFRIARSPPCFEPLETINDFIPATIRHNSDRQGEMSFNKRGPRGAVNLIGGFQLPDGKKAKAPPEGSSGLLGGFSGLFFLHGIPPDILSLMVARF